MNIIETLMNLEAQGVKVFITAAGGAYLAQHLGVKNEEQGVATHG